VAPPAQTTVLSFSVDLCVSPIHPISVILIIFVSFELAPSRLFGQELTLTLRPTFSLLAHHVAPVEDRPAPFPIFPLLILFLS